MKIRLLTLTFTAVTFTVAQLQVEAASADQAASPGNANLRPGTVTSPNPAVKLTTASTDASSNPALATDAPPGALVIEGDELQVQQDRKYKSIGHAALLKEGQNIYGDLLEYDVQNQELLVEGNTRVETPDVTVSGPKLRMRMGENIGEMIDAAFTMKTQIVKTPKNRNTDVYDRNAMNADQMLAGSSVQSIDLSRDNVETDSSFTSGIKKSTGSSRGNAKQVFFEGEDKKRLKDARYTTCEPESDDWYIKASELELDDYTKTATATNARVEFKGVPILYTPWINFSFVNQRTTGLLSPTWGTTSRSGFEVLTPFYWNISPDMDATFATRLLTKRGFQMQGEFRYLGENYSGINNVEYLPSDVESGETRYYIKLTHQQRLSNGWSGGYNLEKVSDDQYFSDMSTRIITTSRVNLAQQANIAYSGSVWNFTGLVQKYQTLDGISYPYQRLPQLTLSGSKEFGNLTANIYNEFVAFDRDANHPRVVTTANAGVLSTGVTGSRATSYPSLSMTLAEPYGYITPKLGIHHTSYNLQNENFTLNGVSGQYQADNRTLPILSVDSGLFFDRDVRVVKNKYTQTLEPRLYYVYIPYQDQSMLPVFDSAAADLNLGSLFLENQFVGGDRINNANQLSLAVTTRMIDAKTGVQRLAATIGQRFYFADQRVGLPGDVLRTGDTSDIVTALTAKLTTHWNIDTAWQYNTDHSETVKSNVTARYTPQLGKVLNLSYRYTKDSLEQVNISGQWPLGRGLYGVGRWNYSISENQPIEGLAGIEYDAGCWQARGVLQRVNTATANANYALFFQLELGGLASIGSNPLNLLNRSIPGYTTTTMIPENTRTQNYE